MESFVEIVRILLPLISVSIIVIFVVTRMKNKQQQSGKEQLTETQPIVASLIPLGLLVGAVIGIVFSLSFPGHLLLSISLGPALGYLGGYVAYEIYSKKEGHS